MKKQLSLILTSLALAFSVGAISYSKKADKAVEPADAASHPTNYADYSYSGSYYNGLPSSPTEGVNGTLRTELTKLINPDEVPTYGSDGADHLSTQLQYADEDPTNSANMIYLYTRDSVKKNAASSWNREHVWPQSLSNGKWGKSRAGADMLHLRPTYNKTNEVRGNTKYGNVSGGTTLVYNNITYGYDNSSYFMPLDSVKGDVARICMYVWVAYHEEYGSGLPALTNVFESFDTIMSWHVADKPDVMEGNRNDYVQQNIQFNRNPFVDHPEYAWKIFGSNCSASVKAAAQAAYPDSPTVGITSISKTSASLIKNNSTTISAISSTGGNISWSSNNTSVATVSTQTASSGSNITINAVGAGSATITASITISGTTYSKSCEVSVAATKQVVSIAVSGQRTSFSVNDTFTLGDGVVNAQYNDGSNGDVTSSATITPPDMTSAGTKTVSVSYSYGGQTASTTYEIKISSSGGGGGSSDYELFSGSIEEGNYIIVYDNKAMNTTVSSNRLQYETVTPVSNVISNPDASIVWHIAADGKYWTIYNAEEAKYAASTNSNNQAQLAASIDDHCRWTVTGSDTFEFQNKSNSRYLRENTTYGYGCYASGTGGALTLYKQGSGSAKTLSSINVHTNPNKLDYEVNDYFEPTGLVIERSYSDESTDTYTYAGHAGEFSFNPTLTTKLQTSDETVEIIYAELSCYLEIDVQEPVELDSISINGYTTSFVEGDSFAFGGTVTANYSDGTHSNVTSESTFSGYDMTLVGSQTVTVSYGGESKTYQITVNAGTVSSIALSGQTTVYTRNAAFSFDGTCTATFANGYEKVVIPTSVSSPDMTTTGNKTVTVSFSYNGKTVSKTYQITVNATRTVYELTESLLGTVTYPENIETISVNTITISNKSTTYLEDESIRVGSGNYAGSFTINSNSSNIYKVVLSAKSYGSDTGVILTIGGVSNTLTNSYANYSKEYTTPTNSIEVATTTKKKRANIQSMTIYTKTNQDISQTEDCVGLETFITNYMHMDYTQNLGYCKDSEHHYYSTAKTAFNELNDHQRSLFTGNTAYAAEWARLEAWASFNGDSLNTNTNTLSAGVSINPITIIGEASSSVLIIVVISTIGLAAIGGYFFLKKRKEI